MTKRMELSEGLMEGMSLVACQQNASSLVCYRARVSVKKSKSPAVPEKPAVLVEQAPDSQACLKEELQGFSWEKR